MKKPKKTTELPIRPTPDGAGLEFELPAPANVERLQWLGGELQKVIEYLDSFPQERPKGRAECLPQYAAGRAMAAASARRRKRRRSHDGRD